MNKKFEQRSAKLKSSNSLVEFAGGDMSGLGQKTTPSNYPIPSSSCACFGSFPLLIDTDFKQETLLYTTDVGVYGNICIWNGKKPLPILEQIAR